MPVKSSDTMLSSHFDNIQWSDSTSLHSWDDEIFGMNLLSGELNDSHFASFDIEPYGNVDISDLVTVPSSPKYQIRHHDCMWSGTCVDKSHPSKKKGINLCATSTTNQEQAISTSSTQKTATTENVKVILNKSIMTPKNIMSTIVCKNNNNKITSGRSLLVNNNLTRVNTNTAAAYCIKQENTSKDQCKSNDLDSIMNTSIANLRPDTPLSLGDDVTELKHNIDLTPCPSSNRMKLLDDPNTLKIINALAEELEETSNSLNEATPFGGNFRNLQRSSPSDLQEILQDITFLSDYEDACDDSSIIDIDDEDQLDESDYKVENPVQRMFTTNIKAQAMTSRAVSHHEFISDHSYTRPKGSHLDMISLGVQTPSDSGECSIHSIINYVFNVQAQNNSQLIPWCIGDKC